MNVSLEAHAEVLTTARAAHVRGDWHASYEGFARVNAVAPLSVDDLDSLSVAAWRVGNAKEAVRLAERVYSQLARRDPTAAALKAIDLGLQWLTRGDLNIGQGWMNRARRLLDGIPEGPAHGYLTYLDSMVAFLTQDFEALRRIVADLRAMAARLDSGALAALAMVAEAIDAAYDARMDDAYGLFDEIMLPLVADDVPIDWAGDIYCMVLTVCHRLADMPRMRGWTQSMERWCDIAGSDTYGGVCDVHKLQLRAASDDYERLENRLLAASRLLKDINSWAAGEGFYQLGEVRRLRGDADGALAAYAEARTLGIDPQPGEALLRCSLGDRHTAWSDLRVALSGHDRLARMRLLFGAVEIALARDDLEEADEYCRELEGGAEAFGTPGFRAWAAHARGMILVRENQRQTALTVLELAIREYRLQGWRFETAQVYEWMALAHRALGDDDVATADAATALSIYGQLGVEPAGICGSASPGGLTKRELEILTAVACGATNRQVAVRMFISEKTVARHLANIYAKLGVSTRTAAVAWAHEHDLID
jgi:DNA-binding NarL/FixJ family response regulator